MNRKWHVSKRVGGGLLEERPSEKGNFDLFTVLGERRAGSSSQQAGRDGHASPWGKLGFTQNGKRQGLPSGVADLNSAFYLWALETLSPGVKKISRTPILNQNPEAPSTLMHPLQPT